MGAAGSDLEDDFDVYAAYRDQMGANLPDPYPVFAEWQLRAPVHSEDIVEEWFIDKHLYHFSARTLMRMVSAAGFVIVTAPDLVDRENLLIVARKMASGARPCTRKPTWSCAGSRSRTW